MITLGLLNKNNGGHFTELSQVKREKKKVQARNNNDLIPSESTNALFGILFIAAYKCRAYAIRQAQPYAIEADPIVWTD